MDLANVLADVHIDEIRAECEADPETVVLMAGLLSLELDAHGSGWGICAENNPAVFYVHTDNDGGDLRLSRADRITDMLLYATAQLFNGGVVEALHGIAHLGGNLQNGGQADVPLDVDEGRRFYGLAFRGVALAVNDHGIDDTARIVAAYTRGGLSWHVERFRSDDEVRMWMTRPESDNQSRYNPLHHSLSILCAALSDNPVPTV